MSATELAAAMRALPIDEKIELWDIIAADIVSSASPEIRATQVNEVFRRRQAWLDGKTSLVPGDEVMAEARALLKRE